MRIVVTGAGGMLGHALGRVMGSEGVDYRPLGRAACDVTDKKGVEAAFSSERPDLVIHAAAFTRVDDCESEEPQAFAVNDRGTRNVAEAASSSGARLIYVSTDYVFSGQKRAPYTEEDAPEPINTYGNSKLAGERAVREEMPADRWVIVRTAWLYGQGGRNFVDLMAERALAGQPLTVVDDQVGNPTWTMAAARAMKVIAEAELSGLYHVACGGAVSWFDFAAEILRLTGAEVSLEAISTGELARPAKRPSFSALDTTKFTRDSGVPLVTWQEALADYLGERGLLAGGR